jgi:hypothetical protein
MRVVDCQQSSPEWLQARTGRITASEVGDATSFLVRAGKEGRKAGDSSGTRDTFKLALAGEILTGKAAETFVSKWMERGTALEGDARIAYELQFDCFVEQVGFVIHPTIDRSGASPDGLVGDDGGLEIKCPKIETHIKYIIAGGLPKEYEPQVMWNLACTERKWWDFISFCPDMKDPGLRIFKHRVHRNEARIAELAEGVQKTLAEVDDLVQWIRSKRLTLKEALQKSVEEPEHDPAMLTADEIDDFFASMSQEAQ